MKSTVTSLKLRETNWSGLKAESDRQGDEDSEAVNLIMTFL